jgi:hypothetical protein
MEEIDTSASTTHSMNPPNHPTMNLRPHSPLHATGLLGAPSGQGCFTISKYLLAVGMGMSLLVCEARAQAWQPAPAPLLTRWAKDVSPESAWPEYPRPQMVRTEWQSLNGLWQYAVSERTAAAPQGYTGNILVPFCIESALSGVGKKVLPQQTLWYHREFQTPRKWTGQRLLLHFDAVDWETTVWLNGKQLGTHRGGYDRFTFDITDALTADGPHQLVVRVWDPSDACFSDPNGPWPHQPFGKQAVGYIDAIHYTSVSGIWQSVWLEPVPANSIESLRLVPDVDGGCLRLTAILRGEAEKCKLVVEATEGGKTVARGEGKGGGEIVVPMANAKLWSPGQPVLYDLKVTLKDASGESDVVSSYFAMRKIAVGPDGKGTTRILLNGKPVFQMGPLDQGYWPDGLYTAPTDAALRFDIELMKRLGFNVVRKSCKVEPERWYYWCDKLGLMVWQDMPSTLPPSCANQPELKLAAEDQRQFELELRRMIEQHANHPSIVMWVIFNETWGQCRSVELTKAVKAWDPARLVNTASGAQDLGAGDVKDGHQYPGPLPGPGPASPNASPTQWQWGVEARPEAKRALVLGEFGGLLRGVEGRTWHKTPKLGGLLGAGYALFNDKVALTSRYQEMLRDVVKLNREIGASAAIYTELTDIEDELNGLVTYDREVLKMDEERVRAANLQATSP